MDLKVALLALLSAVPVTENCNVASASRIAPDAGRSCLAFADGQRLQSTLKRTIQAGVERLVGVTDVQGDSLRLLEDVTLDESGALRRAEAVLTGSDGTEKRVVLDRDAGAVDITTSALHLHWDVPRDYPWIWAPLLNEQAGKSISTPLDARVVWRAAQSGRTVRLLDLGALESYTLTADQVVSREGDGGTVVLGNDASEMALGLPQSLHLAATNTDLVHTDAARTSRALLAALGCTPSRGPIAP
jgi:hypothetical protein